MSRGVSSVLPCPNPDGMWMESKKIRKAVSILVPMNPNASMYGQTLRYEEVNILQVSLGQFLAAGPVVSLK